MAGLIVRNGNYHIQWYEGDRKRRRSLRTDSLQIAKERLRRFESAQARGEDCPLPTRTPIAQIVSTYVAHMRAHRPERSWRKDLTHLREAFGECCEELRIPDGRASRCRDARDPSDGRRKLHPLRVAHLEQLTTAEINDFIAERVRVRGLAPKTANRYREVLAKLITWAMETGRVKIPGAMNPASKVRRYREAPPEISFLTQRQIMEQLDALSGEPAMRAMAAVYIYAGLRREEALWLRHKDVKLDGPAPMLSIRAKTVDGQFWQPKTGVNRAVPISRALAAELRRHAPPPTRGGWYFPSPRGARWDPDNFSQRLARLQRAAGLRWTCLDFRHTFGSQLAQAGRSLHQIATLMGNSPEVCRRHYAALVPAAMHAEVEFKTTPPDHVGYPLPTKAETQTNQAFQVPVSRTS